MRDEPDIFITHILINVDQDQNARRENAEQNVSPLRHKILRIKFGKKNQKNEQNDAREKKRKNQKIKIHKFIYSACCLFVRDYPIFPF